MFAQVAGSVTHPSKGVEELGLTAAVRAELQRELWAAIARCVPNGHQQD
jgi:hypothetical protein